ncbi:MAG: DUF4367 domain-containing protein [Lachnospiraceae bacterium]|nr:DUF4367 domain-containing protein [Ruminococcus sp.]MCM1276939.1 DUF4367 domain-containing protein [Lachnospiraceae bacterium]
MTNDEKITKALEQALRDDIAEYKKLPDHKFSRGFDRKMKRLFQEELASEKSAPRVHTGRKLPIAVIIVIVTFLLMGAAATTYYLWTNFRMQNRGLYTLLHITDVDDCPKTLEEHYRLTADLSGFTENVIADDELLYFVEYDDEDNGVKIAFQQETKHGASMMLNTEGKPAPVEVTVNGCSGIYFESKYGTHVLIWDVDDYLITLTGNGIGKNNLFSLAEFVQKVE